VYYVLRSLRCKTRSNKTLQRVLYYGSTPQNKKDHKTHYQHSTTGASSSMVAVTLSTETPSQSTSSRPNTQCRSFEQTIKGAEWWQTIKGAEWQCGLLDTVAPSQSGCKPPQTGAGPSNKQSEQSECPSTRSHQ
jgi:hypothetical protein